MSDEQYVTPRWEWELTHPEKFTAIYLNESAMRNLKYTLSHVTQRKDLTLSEAIQLICDDWIKLDNFKLSMERTRADSGMVVESPKEETVEDPKPDKSDKDALRNLDVKSEEPVSTHEEDSISDKQCDIKLPHSPHEWDETVEGKTLVHWCEGIGIKFGGLPVKSEKEPNPGDPGVVNSFDINHAAVLEGSGTLVEHEEGEVFSMPLWREPERIGFQLPEDEVDNGR